MVVWVAACFVVVVCVGALFLYLRTWRNTYSVKGKHVLVSMTVCVGWGSDGG